MSSFFRNAWGRVDRFALSFPALVSMAGLGTRYTIGDVIGQRVEYEYEGGRASGKPYVHDYRRSLLFGSFGASYGLGPSLWVYNMIYPRFFKSWHPIALAAFDVTVHCPGLYFPMYYVFKSGIEADPARLSSEPVQVAREGLDQWWRNFVDDSITCAKFWFPANCVNFTYVSLVLALSLTMT